MFFVCCSFFQFFSELGFFSSSFFLSIFAYNSIRVQQTDINDQVGSLGLLLKAMHYASPTWAKSLTKFNPQIQDFKRALT